MRETELAMIRRQLNKEKDCEGGESDRAMQAVKQRQACVQCRHDRLNAESAEEREATLQRIWDRLAAEEREARLQ